MIASFLDGYNLFLSTLSLRRATLRRSAQSGRPGDFYPRSPCGERPTQAHGSTLPHDFYPRSPCGERPLPDQLKRRFRRAFLSTLSLRRATWVYCKKDVISKYFYPRSPCGERRAHAHRVSADRLISIHALLAESDRPFLLKIQLNL